MIHNETTTNTDTERTTNAMWREKKENLFKKQNDTPVSESVLENGFRKVLRYVCEWQCHFLLDAAGVMRNTRSPHTKCRRRK